jgi:putative oxidoreductase
MSPRAEPYAILLLRLTVGGLFIAHLWLKFSILGFARWWGGLVKAGYPEFVIAYTLSAELVGAILITLGLGTRWAALYALPMMVGAAQFWAVRKGFYFTGAGAELPIVWSILLGALVLSGGGPLSLERVLPKRAAEPAVA